MATDEQQHVAGGRRGEARQQVVRPRVENAAAAEQGGPPRQGVGRVAVDTAPGHEQRVGVGDPPGGLCDRVWQICRASVLVGGGLAPPERFGPGHVGIGGKRCRQDGGIAIGRGQRHGFRDGELEVGVALVAEPL